MTKQQATGDTLEAERTFEQFQQEIDNARFDRAARQRQAMGKLVGVFTARQLRDMLDNGEI